MPSSMFLHLSNFTAQRHNKETHSGGYTQIDSFLNYTFYNTIIKTKTLGKAMYISNELLMLNANG